MDIFESLENLPVSEECFDDILSIIEEYIDENEELKNRLIAKHSPILKAKRRQLDKKVKINKNELHNAKNVVDLSKKMRDLSQNDLNKAEENVWNVMTKDGHTWNEYSKAAKGRKEAAKELGDWNKDVHQGENKVKDIINNIKSNVEKRNELNKKVAKIKGQSEKATSINNY